MTQTPPNVRPRQATTIFITGTVAIDALAFALIIPVLPDLIIDLTGNPDIGLAATLGGLATFVFAVMQFIFSPILGGLSDRYGRRPVLLLSLAALTLDFLLMGLAHALFVFFIARMLSGIFAATHSTANAYIADISSPEERARRFGLLGAAMGIGFVIGPGIGGMMGELSPRAPFFAAAALAGINALYGWFVVPESLKPENRRAFDWARSNPLGTLMSLRRVEGLGILIWVYLFSSLSSFVYPAVWAYVMIAKFEWTQAQIGLSLGIYGLVFAFSQAVMVPFLTPRMGDRRAIWIALLVESIALIGLGTAPNSLILYLWILPALISGLQGPALQKVMTERVGADAQGELQGGLAGLTAMVLIISPLIYTQLFFVFQNGSLGFVFPGAPFVLASAFALIGLGLFLVRRKRVQAS